jgi:hypothetical protein
VTEEFRVFDWLKNYGARFQNMREEDMPSVLDFCLVWNLFESTFCNRNVSVPKIRKAVEKLHSSGKLTKEGFGPYLHYFEERYLERSSGGCRTNTTFDNLKFRPSDDRKLVESVLKGEIDDRSSVLSALLIIVYRFRNNLFHGEKEISTLYGQNENFTVANRLLAKVLDLRPGTA